MAIKSYFFEGSFEGSGEQVLQGAAEGTGIVWRREG